MKNYLMISLKGLIALSVLVIAMLIALELRDQRSLQGQLEYKNRLLSELSVITGEELADIETITRQHLENANFLDFMQLLPDTQDDARRVMRMSLSTL